MGANGATKLLQVAENLERIIAIELLAGIQAIEFRRPLRSSEFIENVITSFRKTIPFIQNDKIMYPEISKSVNFMRNFNLVF